MPFDFLCPRGHILQGDETEVGLQCQCPQCGATFLVPAPLAGSSEPGPNALDAHGVAETPDYPDAGGTEGASAGLPGLVTDGPASGPEHFHVPCPQGHWLRVSSELTGQEVACPVCGKAVGVYWERSLERRKQREAEREKRERRTGQAWLQFAIVAALVVLAAVIAMIVGRRF